MGVLNTDICGVIAGMGHQEMLVVADAGLPIPRGTRRIDLALREGVPGFLETVEAIAGELQVERIIMAEETVETSPHVAEALVSMFAGAGVEYVSHTRLKQLCGEAAAVVRTGEFTRYANVVLVAGVVF